MQRLPPWIRAAAPGAAGTHAMRAALRARGLHTVCEEARCPNARECFGAGTATFLILGDTCSRGCAFCAVARGTPRPPDQGEPARLAAQAAALALRHVVVTSVTRDDLPDGGAAQFAAAIRAVRDRCPGAMVEVLVPDFAGSGPALDAVLAAAPDVLNHNIETVRERYPEVRPGAAYERSLALLAHAAGTGGSRPAARRGRAAPRTSAAVKSGVMVGLGETRGQLSACLRDLRDAGVRILTVGQYLRPRRANVPVARYYEPAEFDEIAAEARAIGFAEVFAGPLVRSSYRAGETFAAFNRET